MAVNKNSGGNLKSRTLKPSEIHEDIINKIIGPRINKPSFGISKLGPLKLSHGNKNMTPYKLKSFNT